MVRTRMGEIYCAHYQREAGVVTLLDEERVCLPNEFKPISPHHVVGVGTGWQTYEQELRAEFDSQLVDVKPRMYPQASHILALAQVAAAKGMLLSAEQALPVYLRDNVAKKKGEQKHG